MNSLQKIALGALLLSATGCTLIDDFGRKDTYSPVGLKATELHDPVALEFIQGKLVVTSNYGSRSGILVVDTTSDTITSYHRMGVAYFQGDYQLASLNDSVAVLSRNHVLYEMDLITGLLKTVQDLSYSGNGMTIALWSSERRVFFWVGYPGYFGEVFRYGTSTSQFLPNAYGISGAVVSGNQIFLSERSDARLYILSQNASSFTNTLDLRQLTGDSTVAAEEITSFEGSIFVKLQRQFLDSAYVAVINANTLALEKKIPLLNRVSTTGRGHLRDGIWYLCGLKDRTLNSGGVEAIDLRSRTHLGMQVSNLDVGGIVTDFIPVGPGRGYLTYYTPSSGSYRHLRKVSF